MFSFLHAADIHLDSPLRGLNRYDGAPAEEIRNATRRALENLVDLAIIEKVAFVILAGDLYDGDWRDFNTGLFFVSQMAKLKEASIPVYAISGNHDAANRITRSLPLPENVRVFGSKSAETICVDRLDAAIHGQSFAEQCTTTDLASDYPMPVSGCFNIGILHTSLSGRDGHGNYAPCSEECLRTRGYDYWALGHVHKRETVSQTPWIAFPGNIQGRHVRESGAKGCLLVTVADNQDVSVEFKALDVFRWEVLQVDVTDSVTVSDVLEMAGNSLSSALERSDGRPLAVRVELVGVTTLQQSLSGDVRQLISELRAVAVNVGVGSIWVEKVINSTQPLPLHAEDSTSAEDPISEIGALVEELVSGSAAPEALAIDFSDLRRNIPPELSALVRESEPDWWEVILRKAQSQLLARLKR